MMLKAIHPWLFQVIFVGRSFFVVEHNLRDFLFLTVMKWAAFSFEMLNCLHLLSILTSCGKSSFLPVTLQSAICYYSNTPKFGDSSCRNSQTQTFHWNLTNCHTRVFHKHASICEYWETLQKCLIFYVIRFQAFMCTLNNIKWK